MIFPLALILLAAGPSPQGAVREEPDDDRVRQAWSYLLPEEQAEVLQWFEAEAARLDSFQQRCLDFVVKGADRDAGYWPDDGPLEYFDPKTHSPGSAIPRKRLKEGDRRVTSMVKKVERVRPPRRLRSAWRYDWASGELRRGADVGDPQRRFENALAGFPPRADLAEALVLRALDRGDQRVTLGAFGHAYTDRDGRVFPLSLYEAWSTGIEIEMPDVDCLGIVHTVLDEWKRWPSPVPTSRQKSLYREIGELFAEARRYRGLREALAACYLVAEPVMHDGYGESLQRLHALWDHHGAQPAPLAEELPTSAKAWTDYLADWAEACMDDRSLREGGDRRRDTLAADAQRVRATLVWVLEEFGAFERRAKPRPEPQTPPPDDGVGGGSGGARHDPIGPSPQASGDEVSAKDLEKAVAAVARLRPSPREDFYADLRARVAASGAPQVALVAAVVEGHPGAGKLPQLEPYGPHSGKRYGASKRGRVKAGTRAWKKVAEEVADVPRDLAPLVRYDFAAGEARRLPDGKETRARWLENALAGFAPDQDLAEALILAQLDRERPQRKAAAFFARDYADLKNKAYEDLSLFAVWSHQIPIDVPDIDVKAYAELVYGETGLPEILRRSDHQLWYPRMADSLTLLRRHVRVAEAIAAAWLDGRPNLPAGYATSVDTLHATFGLEDESLDAVVERFDRLGSRFIEDSLAEVQSAGNAAWNRGNQRRDRLVAGRAQIRAAALAALREAGYLK